MKSSSPARRFSPRGSDRRRTFSWKSQLQILVPLFIVWLGGFGVLGAVIAHGNFGQLFLDPAYMNGGVWYNGLVSQLGMVAWSVAAISAAWSAWIAQVSGRAQAARFLFYGAVVGAILLADDLVDIHALLPWIIGIPKVLAQALVLLPLAVWTVRFWPDIVRTRYPVLLAAFAANGVSVMVDSLVHPGSADLALLFEDGPKFLGILAWATYFVLTTRDIARSAMATRVIEPGRGSHPVFGTSVPHSSVPASSVPAPPATMNIAVNPSLPASPPIDYERPARLWANESNERVPSWVSSNDGHRRPL
jgi:hypothetical protein